MTLPEPLPLCLAFQAPPRSASSLQAGSLCAQPARSLRAIPYSRCGRLQGLPGSSHGASSALSSSRRETQGGLREENRRREGERESSTCPLYSSLALFSRGGKKKEMVCVLCALLPPPAVLRKQGGRGWFGGAPRPATTPSASLAFNSTLVRTDVPSRADCPDPAQLCPWRRLG